MRQFISICILFIFMFAACDSPISDLEKDAQNTNRLGKAPTSILFDVPVAELDSVRKVVFRQFKAQHGEKWKISWNEKTGTPLSVFSGTTEPIPGPPAQAARTFLKENVQLFGMRPDLSDLKLARIDTLHDIIHVRFQQMYRNVPVHESQYLVHFRPDGRVDMANGHYYPSIEAPSSPGISQASARRTALSDLGADVTLAGEIQNKLIIYPTQESPEFLLAWKIIVPANAPVGGDWRFIIDASNGQIVNKLNLASSVTGDGDVIEDHPNLTPNPANRNFY